MKFIKKKKEDCLSKEEVAEKVYPLMNQVRDLFLHNGYDPIYFLETYKTDLFNALNKGKKKLIVKKLMDNSPQKAQKDDIQ